MWRCRPAQRVAPRYFGGDFGDDSATLARAAAWRRETLELAEKQAEFFHRLWDNPGGAVKKETLLALELSPDYRHECGIRDRDHMTCCAAVANAVGTR